MYKYGKGGGDEKKNKAGYAYTMVVCVCAVTMKKKKLLGHFVMSAEVKTMKSKVGTNQLSTN